MGSGEMANEQAVERVAAHENLVPELTLLLMRAAAGLWVAERHSQLNFKELRAQISAAIDKADRESI